MLIRATWFAVVLPTLATFAISLPARSVELHDTIVGQLTPAQELVLRELGISGDAHAHLVQVLEAVVPLAFTAVGLLIFWRRPSDWVAAFVSAALITYIMWISPPLDTLASSDSGWRVLATIVQVIGMLFAVTFFLVFPDGKLVPRWTRWLMALLCLWGAAWLLMPGSLFDLANPFRLSLGSFVLLMSWWAIGLAAQVYRYVRVSGPVQRQQTKWVVYGVSIAIVGYLVFGFDRFALPVFSEARSAGVVYELVGVPLFLLTTLVIPVAFAVSIFHYRLWDIDIIIRRTLVYGALTALLAGLYTASITLSQRLFTTFTGEKSDAAIVLTTLVVAASFTPLKDSLQHVAKRYLREPPDARRELRAFADQVRALVDVMDPSGLMRRALDEAVRAFDATCGAVYLREGSGFRLAHTNGDWTQCEGMSAWLEHGGAQYGWIALGPPRHGPEYASGDQALLREMADLVGHATWLAGGHKGTDESRLLVPEGAEVALAGGGSA